MVGYDWYNVLIAGGKPPEDSSWFFKSLNEHANDFRVSKSHLNKLNYAIFGLGNSIYRENYNKVGYSSEQTG
jgi:tRNA wybutosine-synthesizing protein 1